MQRNGSNEQDHSNFRPFSLVPKERGASVPPSIGFNKPVIALYGDPGIPMAAARLFAERARELTGIHIALALGSEDAQHLGRWGRQPVTP